MKIDLCLFSLPVLKAMYQSIEFSWKAHYKITKEADPNLTVAMCQVKNAIDVVEQREKITNS